MTDREMRESGVIAIDCNSPPPWAWISVAELATLRARVAELERERDENAKELDETVRVLIATRNLAAEKMRLVTARERRLRPAQREAARRIAELERELERLRAR